MTIRGPPVTYISKEFTSEDLAHFRHQDREPVDVTAMNVSLENAPPTDVRFDKSVARLTCLERFFSLVRVRPAWPLR